MAFSSVLRLVASADDSSNPCSASTTPGITTSFHGSCAELLVRRFETANGAWHAGGEVASLGELAVDVPVFVEIHRLAWT